MGQSIADDFWDEAVLSEAIDMCEDIYMGAPNEGGEALAEYAVEETQSYTGDAVDAHQFSPFEFYGAGVGSHEGCEDALSETITEVGDGIYEFVQEMEDVYQWLLLVPDDFF